jgi:hypothetical protein
VSETFGKMTTYRTTSRDYLARAIALRSSGSPEALFHAALELRFGIEARLHEYLAGAAKLATVKKGLWQIRRLTREVDSVFDVYEKPVAVSFIHPDTGEKMKIEYTPVTSALRRVGERLGDFLHFTPAHQQTGTGLIERLAAIVDSGISGLREATRGTLLGPPAGAGPKNEQIRLMFEDGCMPSFIKAGSKVKFTITVILLSKDNERAVFKPT